MNHGWLIAKFTSRLLHPLDKDAAAEGHPKPRLATVTNWLDDHVNCVMRREPPIVLFQLQS